MANIHTWALFLLRTALRSVGGPALLSGMCTDPRAHSSEPDVMCSVLGNSEGTAVSCNTSLLGCSPNPSWNDDGL